MIPSHPSLIENIILNTNLNDYYQTYNSIQNFPRNDSFKSTTSTNMCVKQQQIMMQNEQEQLKIMKQKLLSNEGHNYQEVYDIMIRIRSTKNLQQSQHIYSDDILRKKIKFCNQGMKKCKIPRKTLYLNQFEEFTYCRKN